MNAGELVVAAGYSCLLSILSVLLSRSAEELAREATPDEAGELPWPHNDAVALRRVMARTLLVLAVAIVASVAVTQYLRR
jgi:hypothetical protein